MNFYLKLIAAAAVLLLALLGGLYLSGWLVLLLLHLSDQASLNVSTFGQYWRVRDVPQFAPYATRIKIAAGIGFGLPLLLWLSLLALLFKYRTKLAGYRNSSASQQPAAHGSSQQASSLAAQHEQYMMRQLQRINEQTMRELGPPPAPEPQRKPDLNPTNPAAPASVASEYGTFDSTEHDDMNFRQATVAAALAATAATTPALGGCSDKDYSQVQFQQNPHPVERYEITVKVEGAPGPFKVALGDTTYQIANRDCMPPNDPILGAPSPASDIGGTSIELHLIGPQTWSATVYADAMLEAPYFGRAVCHWGFTEFAALLKATGAKNETFFEPSIDGKDIINQKTVVTYFLKDDYPVDGSSINNRGSIDRHRFNATVTDADLFVVTLSARKVMP